MAEESKKSQERAKQGIWRAEREGRRASGLINYGMEWVPKKDNPEVKEWRVNRKELAALKEIRRLVLAGVDTTEIARIFNADLENYPTKYAAKWTAGNVSAKFQSDFLFTRERTVKTGPDTWRNSKIVRAPFFTKAQVMEVRHLLRQKRLCHGRAGPDAERGRFLLHHLAECSCGAEKIYVQDFVPQGKPYQYYRCKECGLRLDARSTDECTWRIYTKIAMDPRVLKAAILEEDFIVDKTTAQLKALRDSSAKRLEELKESFRRTQMMYGTGNMEDTTYEELEQELTAEQIKCERDLRQAVNTLNRPKAKDKAIERAAKQLVELADLVRALEEGRDTLDVLERFEIVSQCRSTKKQMKPNAEIVFEIKKRLFDDLILAGGRIILSEDQIVIHGKVRTEDPEVFNEQILSTPKIAYLKYRIDKKFNEKVVVGRKPKRYHALEKSNDS